MENRFEPRYADSVHHALDILGTMLLEHGAMRSHEVESLGCLLLILAEYQQQAYRALTE